MLEKKWTSRIQYWWDNPETTHLVWTCRKNGPKAVTKNYDSLETWRKEKRARPRRTWKDGIYRVSQEERAKLREGVPYVKLYRYNPKHLYPKLNVFRDNGKWILKFWQLLHTYWLPNSYWNWQEYVVSVMLISVLNIKVTCEWHKGINLNCKVPRIRIKVIHRVRSTIHHTGMLSGDVTRLADCLPACLKYAEICTSSERQQN